MTEALNGPLSYAGCRIHKYAILSALRGDLTPWSTNKLHGKRFSPVASNPRLEKFQGWVDVRTDILEMSNTEQDRLLGSIEAISRIEQWEIPKKLNVSLRRAMIAFREKLIMWEQITHKKKRVYPAKVIARQSILGKDDFASYLSDSLDSSLRWVLKEAWVEDHYGDYQEDAWGHDYFFPPADLPNFPVKEKKEDILRLFEKPKKIKPSDLETFKTYFKGYIVNKDHRSRLDSVDMLSFYGTKASFDTTTLKSKSHYASHIGKRFGWDSRKHLEFKYKWIQKNAAEGRAAVICSPDTLYKIKWLHKSWRAHVSVPGDEYNNPRIMDQIPKILENRYRSKGFIMSDIKKSGLTFSRELNDAIFECLYEVTGDDRYQYFIGYGRAMLHHDSYGKKPIVNGYGLGMMDCVISAAQACIFQILLDTTLGDWTKSFDLKGHFWSDDSLGIIQNKDHEEIPRENLEGLLSDWNEGMIRYGIIIHGEKPFYSQVGVFLEEYSLDRRWNSDKVTQYVSCILDSLTATDIAAAKEITSAVATTATEEQNRWTAESVQRVVDLWGWEFTPQESSYPYEIGGWTYTTEGQNNCLLQFMDQAPETETLTRLSGLLELSNKRRTLKLHKEHEGYINDIVTMHGSETTGAWSWYQASRSALLTDYKFSRDTLSIRKKILRERRDAYSKPVNDHENTAWLNMRKFNERSAPLGWYVPLQYSLLDASREPTYPDSWLSTNDPGSLRLALCAWNGYFDRKIDLNSIELDSIENDPETAFRILSAKFCKKGPIPVNDLIFIWSYGCSPWAWSARLKDKIGRPVKMALPMDEMAHKIVRHFMTELDPTGSVFWTPRGAYCSTLDAFSSMYDTYDGKWKCGIGLINSRLNSQAGAKMHEYSAQEIEEQLFLYSLNTPRGQKKVPQEEEDTQMETPFGTSDDRNEYYTQMIRGFISQIEVVNLMRPPDDSQEILEYTHIPLEGSGYDSDISLNLGLMEDA
jgi:hypothetical protein